MYLTSEMETEIRRQIKFLNESSGMQLNDNKERPILPKGTLEAMWKEITYLESKYYAGAD